MVCIDMAIPETPIAEGQLQFHLERPNRRVRLVQRGNGYTLQIVHTKTTYLLTAQRRHTRVFKNLTLAAEYLKNKGVKKFTVLLEQENEDEIPAQAEDGNMAGRDARQCKGTRGRDWDEE